jgi:mRNA interferase RelE/StbE
VRYQVIFTAPAERAYRKLPKDVQRRVLDKAELLAQNPWPSGSTKLTGHEAYRLRTGDYRIIYSVERGKLLVLVLDVGHRRDIYRDL